MNLQNGKYQLLSVASIENDNFMALLQLKKLPDCFHLPTAQLSNCF